MWYGFKEMISRQRPKKWLRIGWLIMTIRPACPSIHDREQNGRSLPLPRLLVTGLVTTEERREMNIQNTQ
jgi:hypothetical protein